MPRCCFNQPYLELFSCLLERKKPLPGLLLCTNLTMFCFCVSLPLPRRLMGNLCCWCSALMCLLASLFAWDRPSRSTSITSRSSSSATLKKTRATPSWAEENGATLVRGRERTGTLSTLLSQPFQPSFACVKTRQRWEGQGLGPYLVRGGRQKWPSFRGFLIPVIWWSKRLGSEG